MNILIQAWSCSPNKGGEFAVSWGFLTHLDKLLTDNDHIYVVSRSLTNQDISSLKHTCLIDVKVPTRLIPGKLHCYAWQVEAYKACKKNNIKFDIVHVYSLSDFRMIGLWYKFKDSYTIFGPVGGGQTTPKSLRKYDDLNLIARNFVNFICKHSLFFQSRANQYDAIYAGNSETVDCFQKATFLPDCPLNDRYKMLKIKQRNNHPVQIAFCGSLIRKKGLFLLMDIIEELPDDKEFVINIYGDGPLKESLILESKKKNLTSRIKFKGHIPYDKMSEIYQSTDILVVPSLRESGGNVFIEAMAHKIPVVSLKIALSSYLDQYKTGLFVDVDDTKEHIISNFASCIDQLVKDRELRETLGENGYQLVNHRFTWDFFVDSIYGKYVKSSRM